MELCQGSVQWVLGNGSSPEGGQALKGLDGSFPKHRLCYANARLMLLWQGWKMMHSHQNFTSNKLPASEATSS